MRYIYTVVLLCISYSLWAYNGNANCSKKIGQLPMAKTTAVIPEENDYDVICLKLDLSLTSVSTAISGNAITIAKVLAPGFNTYAFELDTSLTIDSFKLNNQLMAVQTSGGFIRKVSLPLTLPLNSSFTAQVFYHGQPASGTGFFTKGLNHAILSSGTHIMYTLSDITTAKDWWPSKQDILDKIDSVDTWVTVPAGIKAGSNGLLKAVTLLPGGSQRYEWETRYPIDYYLISIAVAPYGDYSYYMHFTDGSGDSMLIENFVYDSLAYMTPAHKAAFDSTGLAVDYFSTIYGKYPFYKEKYGHCLAEPLGGGMEHQTMTTLADAQATLIAHELGHQWFGDHVTYGSWKDIWLSEGFATYSEQLFVEHFRGTAAFKDYRAGVFNKVMSGLGSGSGSVYVDDTTDVNRIFDSRLTYSKGASVAHMLRYMAPQDSLFFKVLKQYQQQYAFGNAVTTDLQAIAEQVYNINLDTFFNEWIYKEGYPTYSARWFQAGSDVYIQINQTTSKPSSISFFTMPLELNLKSATGSMPVKVYNNQASQDYHFTWSDVMTGLEIDPNDNILNKTGAVSKDPKMAVSDVQLSSVSIYPNPGETGWHISGLPANTGLVLEDMNGRVVWRSKAGGSTYIPAASLPVGSYILTATKNNISKNFKLIR